MKGNGRLPAFKVSKADRRNLTDQLADGLRQAIVSGFYKAGVNRCPIFLCTAIRWWMR